MIQVVVGSRNIPKLQSVKSAFEQIYEGTPVEIRGVLTDSLVGPHPLGVATTILGARNRATQAKKLAPDADFWVGIEGGMERITDPDQGRAPEYHEQCWVVILDQSDYEGKARGVSIPLGRDVGLNIAKGSDLNREMERVLTISNIGDGDGYVGYATNGIVPRTDSYIPAIVTAMSKFLHPELYQ